ncbi:lipase chaperone [Ideonella sp. BN130291]|uniref:lipase chaperone n=1 Tax=Ideonella sp. BN130291 TaxID=3112940 RepID=UPI002E2637E1|nr:lipase chaperone [Ideonella sp. BN130291]
MARIATTSGLALMGTAAVTAAWWWLAPVDDTRMGATAAPLAAAAPVAPALLAPTPASQQAGLRGPAQFTRWLEEQSSLRGMAELDGSWDVDGQGRFQPTLALRRRFDQLLTLAGEAPVDEITAYIEHEVRDLVGAPGAAAVLDAWQRYLALQRTPLRTAANSKDRQAWLAALAEREQLRQRILGPQLTEAFFAEEQAQLQALLQAAPRDAAAVPPVHSTRIDRTRLDPAALARLQQEDAAWADWRRRLALAQREARALQAAPELSDLQRQQALERLITQQFDAQEAVRVRALLQLSPTS